MKKELLDTLTLNEMDCNITLNQLKQNINTFWSWGVSKLVNYNNKGLLLKVNGHHHKGYVFITLHWSDTYIVHIITTHGNLLNTYEMVYGEDLIEIIDNRIERIPEYVR